MERTKNVFVVQQNSPEGAVLFGGDFNSTIYGF